MGVSKNSILLLLQQQRGPKQECLPVGSVVAAKRPTPQMPYIKVQGRGAWPNPLDGNGEGQTMYTGRKASWDRHPAVGQTRLQSFT